MEIRMMQSIAGADFVLTRGEVTNRFTDAEAIRLIEAGFAVPVADQKLERAITRRKAKESR